MHTTIKATIKLYQKENGRRTPFVTGYRPLFDFEGQETKTSGQITLNDKKEFKPGDEGEVNILLLSKFLNRNFREGIKFTFSEGATLLGEGRVIEIFSR